VTALARRSPTSLTPAKPQSSRRRATAIKTLAEVESKIDTRFGLCFGFNTFGQRQNIEIANHVDQIGQHFSPNHVGLSGWLVCCGDVTIVSCLHSLHDSWPDSFLTELFSVSVKGRIWLISYSSFQANCGF
jgi:hypothetical protein